MPVRQIDHDSELRRTLFNLLSQITLEQQTFFERLYPMGINQIPYERLTHAIMQCQRTIQNNKLNAERKEYLENMRVSLGIAKQADKIISVTRSEPKSDETIKLPITKVKPEPTPEFKCCECGETNKDLQYLTTEYCYVCINK